MGEGEGWVVNRLLGFISLFCLSAPRPIEVCGLVGTSNYCGIFRPIFGCGVQSHLAILNAKNRVPFVQYSEGWGLV